MKRVLISMSSFWLLSACTHSAISPEQRNDLLGAWQLLSVETIGPSGSITYPFYGRSPQGLIIYDRSGWMSVQIVSDPKPQVPTADTRDGFRNSPIAERAAAADGYYAYFGTYRVDSQTSTVTHHLKESLFPGEREEDVSRHYAIDGERLTLVAQFREMGEIHQRRLIWKRLQMPR